MRRGPQTGLACRGPRGECAGARRRGKRGEEQEEDEEEEEKRRRREEREKEEDRPEVNHQISLRASGNNIY